ncbi:hypothetical protein PM8797T_09234 [Gimesia maris DSM 8797]|nr:hypothetical protein PM8797T_09234 [Gimesia maris DSM 8797]
MTHSDTDCDSQASIFLQKHAEICFVCAELEFLIETPKWISA